MSTSTGEPRRSWPNSYRGSHRPQGQPTPAFPALYDADTAADPSGDARWDDPAAAGPDGSGAGCPASRVPPRTDWPINPPYQSAQEEGWHRADGRRRGPGRSQPT